MKRRVPFDIEFMLESLTNVPIITTNSAKRNKLNEDPDAVDGGQDDGSSLDWDEGEAIAFFCARTYSILGPYKTHQSIARAIKRDFDFNNDAFNETQDNNIYVSDWEELRKDVFIPGGIFYEYFDNMEQEGSSFIGPEIRTDAGFLSGRMWRNQEIISFWNEQHIVLRHWDFVEKMFKDFGNRIGPLSDYLVDWLERRSKEIPLTPASLVSSSGIKEPPRPKTQADYENEPEVDETGQFNFFAKLFRNPFILSRLNNEQLKKIREKLHKLDPAVKVQMMKLLGGDIKHKAVDIANKLNMSVAEFNSIWHVDERISINEDPDNMKIPKKKLTAQNKHKYTWYDSPDAVAFLIDPQNKITLYNPPEYSVPVRLTHPDMGASLVAYLADKSKNYPITVNLLNYPGAGINTAEDEDIAPGVDVGALSILQAKNEKDFIRLAEKLVTKMPLAGDISRNDKNFIQGRVWLHRDMISFWNTKDIVVKNFKLVVEFLRGMKLNEKKVLYEFIDSKHIYAYAELFRDTVLTRNKEEILTLMRKQHLDPKAKKKLAAILGNLKQKNNVGWDFMAQRDASMPALQESPDFIKNYFVGTEVTQRPHWKDNDAITFIFDTSDKKILWLAADEIKIANKRYEDRPNHASIIRQFAYFRLRPNNFNIVKDKFGGFSLESKREADPTTVWLSQGGVHALGFTSENDFSAYLAVINWTDQVSRSGLPTNLVLGRYWKNHRVISFWQKKSHVLKYFDLTEKFLSIFGVDPKNVQYEFIDINKLFLYDELFQEDDAKYNRDKKEIEDLLRRQHTDPSAKKKLQNLGYYDKIKSGSKKSLGGFDFKAQRDAAIPALQELIKKFNIGK